MSSSSSSGAPEPVVFVVDDDEAVRDSLAVMLEAEGFAVEAFAAGRTLLEALAPGGRVGCVVADVRMPDMDGLELLERLMARGGGPPVIIMTGHGDVPMAVRAMKAGAVDFIEKPFTPEIIVDTVQRALESCRRAAAAAEDDRGVSARLEQLTPREREVLERLVIGRPNKVIAHELGISPRTVEIHRARVMEKAGARSLPHLVRMALTAGIGPRDA
ncbi:MAG TPA: response regulator FixJ [Geminicoccaceae bacterium]|nr:response regulator FixJ [Geminicoccaceae bacterium]